MIWGVDEAERSRMAGTAETMVCASVEKMGRRKRTFHEINKKNELEPEPHKGQVYRVKNLESLKLREDYQLKVKRYRKR